MSNRSLTATPDGIEAANRALTRLQMTQTTLAASLDITRQPVGNFFRGKPVRSDIFVRICEKLKLEWEVIAGIKAADKNAPARLEEYPVIQEEISESGAFPDIDALVQQTRRAVSPLIRMRCSHMRVLDMSQPIELTGEGGVYTTLRVLEKQTSALS
jgi:predicted NACHT family NTPase